MEVTDTRIVKGKMMSDSKYVIVYHGKQGMMIYKEVAEHCNLKPGQSLGEEQFWEVLRKNDEFGVLGCLITLAQTEGNDNV